MTADFYRLSPLQERLVRAHGGASPRAAWVLAADRPVDTAALTAALRRLAARHPILRTSYPRLPSLQVPAQAITEPPEVALQQTQLADAAAASDWVAAHLANDDPVDLDATPALRVTLARVGEDPAAEGRVGDLIAFELPALAADPGTLTVLSRDLGTYLGGGEPEPVEALAYLDFSEWHHELLADEQADEARESRDYWRRALEPPVAVRPLPGELDASNGACSNPAAAPVPLRSEPALCLLEGDGELPDLLLAGWATLLSRLTGDRRVAIARLETGRDHELLERAAGLFARHLPLNLRIDRRLSLRQLATRVAAVRAAAVEHGDYFERPEAGMAVAAGFRFEEWPATIDAGPATLRPRAWRVPLEPSQVELMVARVGSQLRAELLYDPRRLSATAARYLARLTAAALAAAIADPQRPCSDLPILPAAERHYLSVECNDTAGAGASKDDLPSVEPTVPALFARRAAEDPTSLAVVAAGAELSFGELEMRANRLARELRRRGVGPEAVVGLCLERSPAQIVALLAILKAGGAYLPLDPLYPAERWRSMLRLAQARWIVSRKRFLDPLGGRGSIAGGRVETLCLDRQAAAIAAHSAEPLADGPEPGHLAYVLFTSGSSGRPKGVMIEHRSLVNLASALDERVYRRLGGGQLRVGLNAPLVFDAAVKQWLQLVAGHTLCLVPEEVRPEPARFLAHAAETGLDLVDCTPSQIAPLLDAGLASGQEALPRVVLLGGEAIDGALRRRLAQRSTARFWNVYGPTECTVDATATAIDDGPSRLGLPLRNVRALVLDRRDRMVSRGQVGELCLGGAGLARGYAAAPRTTAARFVPDALRTDSPGERLYRTGDRARRLATGELQFRGRIDHQVKLRGFRIELGEIEAMLRQHPSVRQAVADLRPLADDGRHLVAWIVPSPGDGSADGAATGDLAGDLRTHLRALLPEIMIPTVFVALERLPLNRNGKVDRAALPSPAETTRRPSAEYLAPRNRIEAEIAAIWKGILKVDKVGANDNFFDLGGHSLLLLQVFEDLRQRFDEELTMVEMFNHPTVASLAERLGDDPPAAALAGVQQRVEKQRLARERQRQAMLKLGGSR